MKITARFKLETEMMQSLARDGYSNELLRRKERSFLEKYMLKELDDPNTFFMEHIRSMEPDIKKPVVDAVDGTDVLKAAGNMKSKTDAITLVKMESVISKRYPCHDREKSAFWQWAKEQRRLHEELK